LRRECYGALDLGFKWDTSSLQLLFPWGSKDGEPVYRLLSYFWLPKYAADREAKQVKWRQWEADADVAITEGDTADFPLIKKALVAAAKRYKLLQLNYDERFAQVLAQELQDDHGINVRSFGQTAPNFNGPCRSFEKAIIDGRLRHLGNRVMDWQVGNLTWKDRGGMLTPAKPETNKIARIDGPVAAIMAIDAAEQPDADNWYTPGCLRN
jgi:phage terminase large subunit-like protein